MLTNEEKKVIAEKMGREEYIQFGQPYYLICGVRPYAIFDLNDASLVVDKLMKQGKWLSYYEDCACLYFMHHAHKTKSSPATFIAWFMTMQNGEATNFFRSYYQWVKENER